MTLMDFLHKLSQNTGVKIRYVNRIKSAVQSTEITLQTTICNEKSTLLTNVHTVFKMSNYEYSHDK